MEDAVGVFYRQIHALQQVIEGKEVVVLLAHALIQIRDGIVTIGTQNNWKCGGIFAIGTFCIEEDARFKTLVTRSISLNQEIVQIAEEKQKAISIPLVAPTTPLKVGLPGLEQARLLNQQTPQAHNQNLNVYVPARNTGPVPQGLER